jgi:predicted helicase
MFSTYIPLDTEKKMVLTSQSFFVTYSRGTATSVDPWVYNFSSMKLKKNISITIKHYNTQRELVNSGKQLDPQRDARKGNWTRDWINQLQKNIAFKENTKEYRVSLYRPFTKQNHYFDDDLNQERYQLPKIFPDFSYKNLAICVSGVGGSKNFSALMTDCIPDLQVQFNGQCFPLYYYTKQDKQNPSLWDYASQNKSDYIRRDGVSDFILERAKKQYGKNVTKEDIFYYVYGFLHSPDYRATFANDLKKQLPRLPLMEDVRDFWKFSKAGRQLAGMHVNYEEVEPYKSVKISGDDGKSYRVEKMRFPQKERKDTIIYNSRITISDIPARAYEYVVNGKSAIEWVMERYQITTHSESGITNDPNDWAEEVGNPRYILDLLLSVINVSVKTMEIVSQLPKVKFE